MAASMQNRALPAAASCATSLPAAFRAIQPKRHILRKSIVAPLVLIALGLLFLLSNFGLLPRLGPLFAQWWPLILIIVGGSLLLKRL